MIEQAVSSALDGDGAAARLWVAAWRAALMCTLDGFRVKAARTALAKFSLTEA